MSESVSSDGNELHRLTATAIADRVAVPVRFIGIGEAAEDMQPFKAGEFAEALLG